MKATYVSVWDGGTEITSQCLYDPETKDVTDIESVDVSDMDLDILEREYIILPDGTKIDRSEFTIEGESEE